MDNEECDELNNSNQACLTSEDYLTKKTTTQLTLLVQETFIKLQSLISFMNKFGLFDILYYFSNLKEFLKKIF